ncbi:MAG TPA: MarR family transcriptional regulator [Gammaproteobacteria bacterium]
MERLDVIGLMRALQALERNMSVALMYSGLRIPQFRLLDRLDELGQATVTEMSQQLHITRATASVLINELIAAGVVATIEHASDRRSFHVRLTQLGHDKLAVGRKDVNIYLSKVSTHYSAEMVRMLNAFAGTFPRSPAHQPAR